MKKTALITLASLCLIALPGCISTPGQSETRTSLFDNTKEVSMSPGWVLNGLSSSIRLAAHWNSKLGSNAILTAYYSDIDSIQDLKFNIDGKLVELKPIDELTSHSFTPDEYVKNSSSRRYDVSLEFLKEITTAKKVIIRIDLSKTYVEGVFSNDQPTSATRGIKKFLVSIQKISENQVANK